MAATANRACLKAAAALLLLWVPVEAQTLTPEQASARRPGDYAPVHMDQQAVVRGRVTGRPVRIFILNYTHVGIESGGYALMLESTGELLHPLEPGDDVEATGRISTRGGLAVLAVSAVRVLGGGPPPAPVPLTAEELQGFRHLGRLVAVAGKVVEVDENTAGAYMLIGPRNPYKIFLPHSARIGSPNFAGFRLGDTVQAVGLASQYGPKPPFNRWFELVVAQREHVVRTGHPLSLPPGLIILVLLLALLFGLLIWRRERHLRAQREALRRSHELGEEILGASSAQVVLHRILTVFPTLFDVTGAELYVHNAATQALDKVAESEDGAPVSVPLEAPPGGTGAGAATCFQNRMVLAVPDTARCPFPPPPEGQPPMPRSVLFVPMFVQGEAVGVFEISNRDRTRDFSSDERALAQHLANQIGVSLRLLDQRSVREQLFRTEKLAAVGRLISSVVNELQAPLASICNVAETALAAQRGEGGGQLKLIAMEARKASDMVARLVSFASSEPVEARPVDLNGLLRHMAEFREREWKARGIRVRAVMAEEPLPVLGSEGQLEQVLLDLLVHAEHALSHVTEKLITVRTLRLARKVLVEIGYTGRRGEEPDAGAATALGIGVCRSIIAGHGGELRAVYAADADPRFEIELPRAARDRATLPARDTQRNSSLPLTALVIEPDEAVERHLLGLLTARGYRVVPVHNSDIGLDLSQRMRFDVAFCSVRAPGLNWVELSESMQVRVGGFVLLSDGYDPELASDFEGDNRFVLSKPIDENHLDRVLQRVENTLKAGSGVG